MSRVRVSPLEKGRKKQKDIGLVGVGRGFPPEISPKKQTFIEEEGLCTSALFLGAVVNTLPARDTGKSIMI